MKKLIVFALNLLCIAGLFGQGQAPDWKVDFPGKINWIATSPAGNLVLKSGTKLCGLEPSGKSVNWTLELGQLTHEVSKNDVQMIPASPLMILEKPSGLINTKLQIINYFDGQVLFDSKEIELPRIIDHYPMFDIGGLLLKTKGDGKQVELVFIDFKEQKISWRKSIAEKPEKRLSIGAALRTAFPKFRPEPILDPDGHILYPTKKDLFRLNGTTGEMLWTLDLKKIEDIYFSEATGRQLYVAFDKNKFSAIQLDNGSEVWKKPIKLKGDFSNMFPHKDGFVVVQTSLVSKIDGNTGKDMWKKEPKLSDTYDMLLDGDQLYTVSVDGSDKALIHKLDLNSGQESWKKPIKVKAPVEGFEFTPKGLLYLSAGGSNIIDLDSGAERWKKDLKLKGQPIYLADVERHAYLVYGNKKLYRIDTKSGDFALLLEDIKFQGKEDVSFIEKRTGGYLLGSSQNFMKVDYDGKIGYHHYFPPHQLSGLAKVALGAAALGAQAYGVSQELKGLEDLTMAVGTAGSFGDPAVVDQRLAAFEKHVTTSAVSMSISDAAINAIVARYKATFETYDDAYVLTSDKGVMNQPIFVKLNKDEGKVSTTFDLKSAKPVYSIDEVDGVLYIAQGKVLECFKL
ncbi:MAG: PQQ-like beta-propeller repeat protein [Saprospiraceae bacterium]|nr:PQQ-like beta-propeller repeat protein [Saprospiraceae bacterium]